MSFFRARMFNRRPSFKRRSFMPRYKPHVTRNRFQSSSGAITAATELQTIIASCVEAPTSRGPEVPAGCTINSIVINARGPATVAKYQALLVYRPGAENVAVPIASYWDVTDPLTEEGVKLRRLAMSRCQTRVTTDSANNPYFTFRWKGNKRMYDGDDISLWFLSDVNNAGFDCQTWLKFTQ